MNEKDSKDENDKSLELNKSINKENNLFGMNDLSKNNHENKQKLSKKKSFHRQFTRKNTRVGISYQALEDLSKKEFLDVVEGKSSITNAEEHLIACRIYDYEKLEIDKSEYCDDCLVPIPKNEKECQLNLCFDSKSLIPYGLGFYMYFFYLKFIIVVNLIAILIVSIPQSYYCITAKTNLETLCLTNKINITLLLTSNSNQTITNSIKNYYYNTFNLTTENQIEKINYDIPGMYPSCKEFVNITNQFKNSFLWQMSYEALYTQDKFVVNTYNNLVKNANLNIDLNMLNFIAEIIIIIVNFLLVISAFNISISLESSDITPKDYALILNNVPNFLSNEEIKSELKVDEVEIHEIIRTYKLEEFNIVKNKYLQYKSEMIDMYNYGNKCCKKNLTIKEILERMKIIDEFMSKYLNIVNKIEGIENEQDQLQDKNEDEINKDKNKDNKEEENSANEIEELDSDNKIVKHKKDSIDTGINLDLDDSKNFKDHINEISKKEFSSYKKLLVMVKKQNSKSDSMFDFFNQKGEYLKEIGVSNLKIKNQNDILNSTCFLIFNKVKDADKFHSSFPNSSIAYIFYLIMLFFSTTIFYCLFSDETRKKYRAKVKYICTVTEEPSDIIWENLQYSPLNRLLRTILIYLISICILCGSAVALFYISQLQISYNDRLTINQRYLISLLFSSCIYVINQIIIFILSSLTDFEKHESYSYSYLSHSYKLLLIGFVNDAIIPVIVFYFSNDWQNKEILISNVSIIFLVQIVVNPLYYLVNPFQILKQIRRNYIRKKFENNKTESELNYSQKELNKIFENVDIELPEKYAYIGKLTLMAIFYIPIFPLGPILVLVSTFLLYWIEKYNIKTTYKIPPKINQIMTIGHLLSFKLFIFVYAISMYVFIKDLKSTYFNFSLVSLIIFSILVIVPFGQILNIKLVNVEIQSTYEEEYLSFLETYQNQNPITRKSGYLNVLLRMKNQNLIDEEEYLDLKKSIIKGENIDIMDLKQDKLGNFNVTSPNRLLTYFYNSFLNNKNINSGLELFFNEREEHFRSEKAKERIKFYMQGNFKNIFTKFVNKFVKNVELKEIKVSDGDGGYGTNNDLLLIEGNK